MQHLKQLEKEEMKNLRVAVFEINLTDSGEPLKILSRGWLEQAEA